MAQTPLPGRTAWGVQEGRERGKLAGKSGRLHDTRPQGKTPQGKGHVQQPWRPRQAYSSTTLLTLHGRAAWQPHGCTGQPERID